MSIDFKEIHIGKHIEKLVSLKNISDERIYNFFKKDFIDLDKLYNMKSIDSDQLLMWSKLLKYNLFSFYNSHLQIYSPDSARSTIKSVDKVKSNYSFSKNYYSNEVIQFIVDLHLKKNKPISFIIKEYNIPKTTIYRWIKTRNKSNDVDEEKCEEIKIEQINYRNLYRDIVHDLNIEDSLLINRINNINNYSDVKTVDEYIFNNKYSNQVFKSFDEHMIKKILSEQKKDSISDRQIAFKYKISRNTIAKWKKYFD